MSDDTGLLEHARGAIPRLGSVPAKRHVGSEVFNTRTDALACLFTYYMTRMRPIPGGPRRSEPMMPIRQLEALMWAQACEAMDRADRLHRQFFHRAHATSCWEAPCDVFETDEVLTVVIALPGVELDQVKVTLSAGVLIVSAERSLPREVRNARIHRLEIPHGHFERRIELPPTLFEISSRHLANGCLMLQLHKL